jgi:hypothetical protein
MGMSMKSAKNSRWMNWTPKPGISEDSPEMEPTKPSKPGFVGFDGSISAERPDIQVEIDQHPDIAALHTSMKRLQANHISVAVSEDGTIRIAETDTQARELAKVGFTVYSPSDMYHYVQLEPHERRMLRNFTKQFGGTIEWRSNQG